MKEIQTKDGIIIKYVKNEEKSVNGVGNVFNIYTKENKLLGQRVGARDLKDIEYESLFATDGGMIFDPKGKFSKKEVQKDKKAIKPPLKKETQAVEALSIDKLPTGGYETILKFRLTIKSKRKVTVEELVNCLEKEKKWSIVGYEVESKIKPLKGVVNDNIDERAVENSTTER